MTIGIGCFFTFDTKLNIPMIGNFTLSSDEDGTPNLTEEQILALEVEIARAIATLRRKDLVFTSVPNSKLKVTKVI